MGFCQTQFQENYDFLLHLKEIEANEEGILLVDQILQDSNKHQRDTLNYMKGLLQYNLKFPSESINSFNKVGNSNTYFKAHASFLSAFQWAYLEHYDSSQQELSKMKVEDPFHQEIKLHELAGVSLLQRDLKEFDKYSAQFSNKYFQLSKFQDQMIRNKEGLSKAKRKSPLLAGVLSGIVPGAGKFYVGKVGEGYTTLLFSTILALGTREAYRKDGPSSFRFKLFASLFSTLYVANIWGSVLSVKIYKDDFNATFDKAILLNMHVPLRTIFK